MIRPFDESGVDRDAAGVKRYAELEPSVVAMLRRSVERDPAAEAIVEVGGPRLSFSHLWGRAARVAGGLRRDGVADGARVALRRANGADWAIAFFGILMAGGVVVPVNTRFTDAEARWVIDDAEAAAVIGPDDPLPDGPSHVADELERDDLAAIFYTSGTTGFPKGAETTHENFLTNVENARRVRGLAAHDPTLRDLISVPLFHVTGCNSQLLTSASMGAASVIMPSFDVPAFLRAIEDERIGLVVTVPAIYWLAVHHPAFASCDTSTVRHATYGGAPITPALARLVREAFPSARTGNGFGLTETSSIATFLPHEYAAERPESVGFASPTADLEIDAAGPAGEGELLVRGAQVVRGYWRQPEATAATFSDGWLRTGDIARIDADGFTMIVDRAKDMINRGGENVYTVEVENVLAAAPGVFEIAVVAVPDEVMGEKVGAAIVPEPGRPFDRDAFLAFARERLADFKVPEYLQIRAEHLPRNPGGKVQKQALRGQDGWQPA